MFTGEDIFFDGNWEEFLSINFRGLAPMRSVILLVFFSVSLQTSSYQILTRRLWLRTTAPTLITPFLSPISANAIDPSLLRTFPIEGDTSGSASRLANLAAIQQSKIDTDPELVDVIEGVQTREYKKGDGPQASDGSRVGVEMTVRCSTVTSTTEPNGAMIFSTSRDDDLGELIFRIGKGDIPASLEKSIKGMSRGGIKRIYLSSERAYEVRLEEKKSEVKQRADNISAGNIAREQKELSCLSS